MGKLLNLPERHNGKGKTTFNKYELNLLISLYSEHVQRDEWRAYALDSTPNTAIFSVFSHSNEQALYTITKTVHSAPNKSAHFSIQDGQKTVTQDVSLKDALHFFQKD